MANVCEITGKRKLKGHRVSHANNKTIHFQQPNLHAKSFFLPELGRRVKITVSTRGLRTIDKAGGLSRYLITARALTLNHKLAKIRTILLQKEIH